MYDNANGYRFHSKAHSDYFMKERTGKTYAFKRWRLPRNCTYFNQSQFFNVFISNNNIVLINTHSRWSFADSYFIAWSIKSLVVAQKILFAFGNFDFLQINTHKIEVSFVSDDVNTELIMKGIANLNNLFIVELESFLNSKHSVVDGLIDVTKNHICACVHHQSWRIVQQSVNIQRSEIQVLRSFDLLCGDLNQCQSCHLVQLRNCYYVSQIVQ